MYSYFVLFSICAFGFYNLFDNFMYILKFFMWPPMSMDYKLNTACRKIRWK